MQSQVIGSFLAGVVLCAGVTGGGLAVAKQNQNPPPKQVSVTLEWISTVNKTRILDKLVIVGDDGVRASSDDCSTHEASRYTRHATIRPVLNADGTVTIELRSTTSVSGKTVDSAQVGTTVTMRLGESRVVKGFSSKGGKEITDAILLITPTVG